MNEELPDGMSYYESDGKLVIRKKWPKASGYFGTVLSAAFIIISFFAPDVKENILFQAAFIAAALCGAYWSICFIKNSTYIIISPEYLEIMIRPLAWSGNKKIRIHDLKQFFVKEHLHDNAEKLSITLRYEDKSGEDHVLLSGFQSTEEPLFLENKIEEILGIENDHRFESPYQTKSC